MHINFSAKLTCQIIDDQQSKISNMDSAEVTPGKTAFSARVKRS